MEMLERDVFGRFVKGHNTPLNWRIKMRAKKLGKPSPKIKKRGPLSREHREKLSIALKGKNVKRVTKICIACRKVFLTKPSYKTRYCSRACFYKHHIPWNKGKSWEELYGEERAEELKQKLPQLQKGIVGARLGHHHSEETKRKLAEKSEGNKSALGHKLSLKARQRIRQKRLLQILPKKDTLIERLLELQLRKRKITFSKHIPIENLCQPDFTILTSKIAIFCDGDYWHRLPNVQEKDSIQNSRLKDKGWTILRFWEKDILKNSEECAITVEKAYNWLVTGYAKTQPSPP